MPSIDTRVPASRSAAALLAAALLAGCAGAPKGGSTTRTTPAPRPAMPAPAVPASSERDGVEATPPPVDLATVPDAQPQVEPIRSGGPNKPYEVLGQSYVPIATDQPYTERGIASWYGRKFHGRRTASGEVYNMYAMTAAHRTLPIPSYARVRNPANGREVIVRINDRGPFVKGRIVDLSFAAATRLGVEGGIAPVEVERLTFEDIRTGAWRRDPAGTAVAAAAPPPPAAPASPAPASVPPPPVAVPAEAVVPVVARPADVAPAPAAAASAAEPPVADAPGARALTTAARGFWIQLGAFRQRDGAETFHKRVAAEAEWIAPMLALFDEAPMFKLQAGPFPGRDEARAGAERLRAALQLVPVIVERR